jgi:hypothetical protein
VEKRGRPGGEHSWPEVRTIGRIRPQHGCRGSGLKAGGVGCQAPGTGSGRYRQVL